jgi:hypothetical protein
LINYQRLYSYRFKDVDQRARQGVWNVIAEDVYCQMGHPSVVLDPAAGRCEFMNAIPAAERWIVDHVDHADDRDPAIKAIIGDILSVDLPDAHFDGVFVSNFLEHLPAQDAVADFLSIVRRSMRPMGRIAIMGPNFKYCYREYFDCADHTLALTHVAVEEHLYAAGFQIEYTKPRYLPYSFRGILPPSAPLTSIYLKIPLAQRVIGKQFLIIASSPGDKGESDS